MVGVNPTPEWIVTDCVTVTVSLNVVLLLMITVPSAPAAVTAACTVDWSVGTIDERRMGSTHALIAPVGTRRSPRRMAQRGRLRRDDAILDPADVELARCRPWIIGMSCGLDMICRCRTRCVRDSLSALDWV
jgi:hypothetical protein